jgi:hypothetical protein
MKFADACMEYDLYEDKRRFVLLHGEVAKFDKMYDTDPLHAWGVYAYTGMDSDHQAHLSIGYSPEKITVLPEVNLPRSIVHATLVVADCQSNNPWEWKVLD